ncbi:flagellar basal body L-ring protein FlgH [Frateuria aurantia]|uniref:Flagellar L-ring protein n=1 Tax=Frateuria aurantia (strain ATCC 33424 / DSM 6220 / KCTC 2777 / LMG 1558 / NBRC 3245 / NCIMB 13370) TaxID=767434 RepID=H8L2T5_FRAAD|nr:flagellar basal body L-ring protein FlgH [Frateuria aurantia]AFC86447.1 flagellar basal body L-ring protein [Frateuria aurantia DSM 6220]
MSRSVSLSVASLLLLCLGGCAALAPSVREDPRFGPTDPDVAAAPPTDGAIYHGSNSDMELFTDARAHRIGDILTITLNESTAATKQATTTTSKTNSDNMNGPTVNGVTYPASGGALLGVGSKHAFAGAGTSTQSNDLTGEITVTVAKRLSNGNLLVIGEKWLTINQGQELIRISGIVRPVDIAQDNTVESYRVADARITYAGRGAVADSNTQGWLSRFFNSRWAPY